MLSKQNGKIGFLEEEAFKRKERLKELKRKAQEISATNKTNKNTEEQKSTLQNVPPNETSFDEQQIAGATPIDIETEVQSQLDLLKSPMIIDEIDIANLAPRKPDWDLKRDVSKKLDKLEKRTQRAIAELIRERLKTTANNPEDSSCVGDSDSSTDNILQVVNVGSAFSH